MQFMKIIKSYSPNTLISSSIVNQVNQASRWAACGNKAYSFIDPHSAEISALLTPNILGENQKTQVG